MKKEIQIISQKHHISNQHSKFKIDDGTTNIF